MANLDDLIKKYENLANDKIENTIKEASIKLNIPYKNILNYCKHRKNNCIGRDKNNYKFMYLEEYKSLGGDNIG